MYLSYLSLATEKCFRQPSDAALKFCNPCKKGTSFINPVTLKSIYYLPYTQRPTQHRATLSSGLLR